MNKFYFKLLLSAIIIFCTISIIKGYLVKYDTENHGKFSIGKYVSYEKWAKGECNYFIYYVKGKKYRGNGGRAEKGFSKNIGNFYRLKYSEKYPDNIIAFFDKQVKDTIAIYKAGFSQTEVRGKLP